MKISIIIVSFNVKEFVKRCIESIQKYAGSYDYEIIVIDNNSEDNTTGFLKDSFPDIKLIENDRNIGFGAANNIAAEIATGEILVFANPDTELTSSIDKLVMLSSKKNIGAVFGKLKYPDGEVQEFIRKFPTLLNQLVEVFGIPLISERFGGTGEMMRRGHYIYEKEGEIEAASGAFFLMKKKAFDLINGFDEDFFIYGEETDLFYRMRKIGLKVYYYPEVEIIHQHGKSTGGNYNMYALQQKSRSLFIEKNKMYFLYLLFRFILQPLYDLSRVALYMLRLLGKRDKENSLFGIKRHLAALRWELFNVLKLG